LRERIARLAAGDFKADAAPVHNDAAWRAGNDAKGHAAPGDTAIGAFGIAAHVDPLGRSRNDGCTPGECRKGTDKTYFSGEGHFKMSMKFGVGWNSKLRRPGSSLNLK
jgi:hypothetical protein